MTARRARSRAAAAPLAANVVCCRSRRSNPEVAITLGNLGNVQQQVGEFEAARASQQRALAIKEAVYGPEHPDVAITLGNLGNL